MLLSIPFPSRGSMCGRRMCSRLFPRDKTWRPSLRNVDKKKSKLVTILSNEYLLAKSRSLCVVVCVLLCVCCLRGVSDIRVAHQLISWLTEEWHAGDALSNPCYYYWHYLDRWQVARPRNGCQDHNKQIKKRVDLPFPLYEYSFPTGSLNLISREPLAGLFCLPRDRLLYAWNHRAACWVSTCLWRVNARDIKSRRLLLFGFCAIVGGESVSPLSTFNR